MSPSFSGLSVLVTRPEEQAHSLIEAIEARRGLALRAPMLSIRSRVGEEQVAANAKRAVDAHCLIFVSRNAVIHGVKALRALNIDAGNVKAFAVGSGTAAALEGRGFTNIEVPSEEFSSIGLLALDALQRRTIANRQIVIFRGLGGRELLGASLRERGAEVHYCECYERRHSDVSLREILGASHVQCPDLTLASSVEVLTSFTAKLKREGLRDLFKTQMLVVSSRIARQVIEQGFTYPPVIVDNPSDEAVIIGIERWLNSQL
ncbi:MAG: uroporphyrinogen-III synthase [Pseudomonadota bacterium]